MSGFRLFPLKSINMNDEKNISCTTKCCCRICLQPPASSLQPASLVVPPCQDIAHHIPNQEDNKVVKKRERETAPSSSSRYCSPLIKLSFTVSKKRDILYAMQTIERARGLHSTSSSSSSFYLLLLLLHRHICRAGKV